MNSDTVLKCCTYTLLVVPLYTHDGTCILHVENPPANVWLACIIPFSPGAVIQTSAHFAELVNLARCCVVIGTNSLERQMQFCAGIATELQLRLMLLATVQLAAAVMLCDDLAQRASVEHRFQAFAHCRRSNKTQVGLANYRRIERCADLARQRRALAFNYAPINAAGRLRTERNGYDVPSDGERVKCVCLIWTWA